MPDASRRTQLLTRIVRPHGLISHIRARLGSGFRLGIAASLSLSFIAVAFLAVLANLIAAQGASVVQSSRIMTVPVPAPTQAPKLPERPPLAASVPEHSQPAPVEVRSVSSNALMLAIDRFERATQARVEADSAATAPQFKAVGEELFRSADNYVADVARLTGVRPKGLAAELKTYRDRAEELVRDADAQRRANAEYAEHLEALNARMKKAIDDAPKIFGRVLARQSLMRLRTNLDDMRRDFAAFSGDATADTSVTALKASEAAFNATLQMSEKGYQRAEGASWVQEMRANFAAMVMLRAELTDLQTQRGADTRRWSESGSRLAAIIPKKVEVAASAQPVPAAPASAKSAVPVATVAAERDVVAQPAAPAVARPDLRISAEALPVDEGRISLVAWITAAVLVVLLAISLLTILSVLRPIKRMLTATAAIARGDISARVPRGGIRELDTLGVAFNDMAEKLSTAQLAAQGYQQQLESRVEERTRQLKDLAERDPLTGLPNRRELFTRLQQAAADAARSGRRVGVFFMDVDNFKNLNDSLGHAYGDRVLVGIGQRLESLAEQVGLSGRLGGDEFTVVLGGALSDVEIRSAGEALVAAFQQPILLDGHEISVSVSVGVSVFPEHGRYAEELLTAADAALYRAKALGRNRMAMYTPELLTEAANKFTTEQRLRGAIERNEFELVYQPEVSLDTRSVEVVEALIRWRAPDGRLLLPKDFLAVAEESGLIVEINDWVLRTAIDTAARWHRGAWPGARVAINVTARQLLDPRFVDRVRELLEEASLPPACIEIELTETVLQTAPETVATLERLQEMEVAVALDDFGTGYSSLASLEVLPLTRIKLDRSVVTGIDSNARSAMIAGAIVRLCDGLGLKVTAEGIEREEQFFRLAAHRNITIQGFLLCGPVPAGEVLAARELVANRVRELVSSAASPDYGGNVIEISSVA